MEVEVLTEIRAALGEILADVFGYVIGRCYRVTDGRQRAKAEGVHIIRPVQETAVYEPLGSRWSERGQHVHRQPGDQAVYMPRAILVVFGHQQELYLGVILLALVTDELGKAALVGGKVKAVELCPIYGTREEVVPRIAEGVLQHHISSTAETVIQLVVVVLSVLSVAEIDVIRVTHTLECHDFVDAVTVFVDAVNGGGGNRHIAGTSRNSLWCQVPSSELSLRPVEGSSDDAHPPDVHSKSEVLELGQTDAGALAPAIPFDDDLVTQFRRVAAGGEDTIHHIDAVTGQAFTLFTLLGEEQIDAGNLLAVITLERGLAETDYFHVVVLLFVV